MLVLFGVFCIGVDLKKLLTSEISCIVVLEQPSITVSRIFSTQVKFRLKSGLNMATSSRCVIVT